MSDSKLTGSPVRSTAIAVGILLSLVPAPARGQETGEGPPDRVYPRILFNGFGTFGIAHSSEDQADFVPSPLRPDGPGFSDEFSVEMDSRLAGQLTVDVTPRLRAIVQVVAEQQPDDRFGPTLEWANISYAFTPDLTLRVGRIALPAFMLSDFRKVGYAIPWVRPPVELYSLAPVFSSDGVDATYRLHLGDWTNTMQATFGQANSELPGETGHVESDGVGFFNTLEQADLLLRFGIAHGSLDIESVGEFFDLFRSFGPEGAAIADRYDADDKALTFYSFGASYDPGAWFVTGELGRIEVDAFIGNSNAWYVGGGVRLGRVTPYALYSGIEATSETAAAGLDVTALPPEQAQAAAGLNIGLNAVLSAKAQQQTGSIGARWDFMRNIALKVQLDRIDVKGGSPGTFINLQSGFERGGTAYVLSAGTAFVF